MDGGGRGDRNGSGDIRGRARRYPPRGAGMQAHPWGPLPVSHYFEFLPAALAEAGLEVTFKVTDRSLAGEVETFVNLAGEVVTFVNMIIDTLLVMEH